MQCNIYLSILPEINKHPAALAELKKLWSTTMVDGLSLACVTDDEKEQLVAVNVLTVAKKEDKDEPFHVISFES